MGWRKDGREGERKIGQGGRQGGKEGGAASHESKGVDDYHSLWLDKARTVHKKANVQVTPLAGKD